MKITCSKCGYPISDHPVARGTMTLEVCPKCGHKLDAPVTLGRPLEGETKPVVYESIVEDV